jgi:lipoyl(octanoyl) transferase
VSSQRVQGRSGVWVRGKSSGELDRKIAAIGVRVSQGVTMHGFALNCDCDLSAFERIIPCGISDAGVTSLTAEAERQIPVDEALPYVEKHLAEILGPAVLQ